MYEAPIYVGAWTLHVITYHKSIIGTVLRMSRTYLGRLIRTFNHQRTCSMMNLNLNDSSVSRGRRGSHEGSRQPWLPSGTYLHMRMYVRRW